MTTQEIKSAWIAYRENNPMLSFEEDQAVSKFIAFLIQRTQHQEINNPKVPQQPNPDITHG